MGAQRDLESWKKNCGSRCSGCEELVLWPDLPNITHEYGQSQSSGLEGITINSEDTHNSRTSGKQFTPVKIKNNYEDQAAVLVIIAKDGLVGQPTVLQPGQTLSVVLKEGEELLAHRLITPEEAKSPDIIRTLKNAIHKGY